MNCAPLIHLFALHFGQYNETAGTPGVGVVCDTAPVEVAAGVYRNSDKKTSVYAVAGGLPWSVGPMRFGAFAGTVNGYDWKNHGGFIPFGGLQASLPTAIGTLRFQLVPRPSKHCTTALGVALEF